MLKGLLDQYQINNDYGDFDTVFEQNNNMTLNAAVILD